VWACWRAGFVGHIAKFPGPGCEQVSAANLLGRVDKFISRKVAEPQSPKKQRKAANLTLTNQKSAFVRGHPRPIFIRCLALLPSRLLHNPIFTPFFRPALGLCPCSGLTSALKGRASRPRWKLRDWEADVVFYFVSWPAYPPAPGAGR